MSRKLEKLKDEKLYRLRLSLWGVMLAVALIMFVLTLVIKVKELPFADSGYAGLLVFVSIFIFAVWTYLKNMLIDNDTLSPLGITIFGTSLSLLVAALGLISYFLLSTYLRFVHFVFAAIFIFLNIPRRSLQDEWLDMSGDD